MIFSQLVRGFPVVALVACAGAFADPIYDADVTNEVIFGSGNSNGGFTVSRSGGLEIGLRAKLRFNENNLPENTFNSNGDGSYTFQAGNPPTGFGFDANNPTTPIWNFEWSVNTDYDGSSGLNLSDFNYFMTLDVDPGPGVLYQGTSNTFFDPINVSLADHAIGNNNTANGGGTVAGDSSSYLNLINNNNIAQNSWSYEFFNAASGDPTFGFDPTVAGNYLISFTALPKSETQGGPNGSTSTSINVRVESVPTPATLLLLLTGIGGIGVTLRRRRNVA